MGDIVIQRVTNVGDLMAVLKRLPPDTQVMQARDEESNGFLPLMAIGVGRYLPEADEMLSIDEDPPNAEYHNVVCLWPAH